MKTENKRLLKLTAVFGVFFLNFFGLLPMGAIAQDVYPAKDITFICHAQPGGGYDITARSMGPFLTKSLKMVSRGAKGGEIIVKNTTGGSGGKAYTYLYENAKPDGYVIGDFNLGDLYECLLGPEKLAYDIRNFTWLFTSNQFTRVIISNKKGPATWEEMIALSKKQPLKWGMGSFGGAMHIEAINIIETVGIPTRFHIAGGTAKLSAAIIRGDANVAYVSFDSVKNLINTKEVNLLLTFTEKRMFPEIPTIVEKGFPQLLKGIANFRVVMGPPNLEPQAKRIIVSAAKHMISDAEYRNLCKKLEFDLDPTLYDNELKEFIENLGKFYKDISPRLEKYLH